MKKLARIPVRPHIKKFLTYHAQNYHLYAYDPAKNLLELKERIPFRLKTNYVHSKKYLRQHLKTDEIINVLMVTANYHNLYCLCRHLEKEFHHHFFLHMVTSKRIHKQLNLSFCAMDTIRNFLDSHHIAEDDYNISTAYKAWQRYKEKRKEKQNEHRQVHG